MLYKRPNSAKWWTRFTKPDGKELRRSTGTEDKRQAEEYEARLKADFWRQSRLGEKPRRTWQEAAVRWEAEAEKKSIADDIGILRQLHPHLGALALADIDKARVDAIIQALRQSGLSPGRVNRITALVRAILRKAERHWGWLDRAPAVPKLKEPPPPIRWLTPAEAARLLAELPPHLEAMARFTLATGLRAANVTGLRWRQVDLGRRVAFVAAEDAKGGKPLGIPLNADALEVLRAQRGQHPEYVFAYQGRPCGPPNNTAWQSALKRAGIEDFRWHDLRHTWASWHVQAGTPLNVLKDLGGWASYSMVLRYAHLAPEHLAAHADRLAAFRTLSATQDAERQKKSG